MTFHFSIQNELDGWSKVEFKCFLNNRARMKKYLQEKQKKKQFNHNSQVSIIKQSSFEKKKPIAIKHANNKKTSILSNELENTVRSFDN